MPKFADRSRDERLPRCSFAVKKNCSWNYQELRWRKHKFPFAAARLSGSWLADPPRRRPHGCETLRNGETVKGALIGVERRASLDALCARRRRRTSPLDRLAASETTGLHEVGGAPCRTWRRVFATHALTRDKSSRAGVRRFSNQALELKIALRLALSVVTAPNSAMTSHMSPRRHHLFSRRLRTRGGGEQFQTNAARTRNRHTRNRHFPKFRISAILPIIRRTGVAWVAEAART